MKAIVGLRYGPPELLQFQEVEKPVPNNDELLIEVVAATINKADYILICGKPFLVRMMGGGLFRPKNRIPGSDMAGRVVMVGKDVTKFKVGDEVFGNLSRSGRGAYAECARAKEDGLVLKPANVTFEEAASVPIAGLTALQGIRDKGKVLPGQKVLINGASGGVGTFAVQIAKFFGAEVTAVCSTANLDLMRRIGADHVIDYTKEDFTQNGQEYDLIIGANGYHPIWKYKRSLSAGGTYVMSGGKGPQLTQALFLGRLMSLTGGKKLTAVSARMNNGDLAFMAKLLSERKVVPFIEKIYPLNEAPQAIGYLGKGHVKGKLIISINDSR
jgi:NADPH:quinone reductase-like Zn-dependent oxidoreductase